jgi:GT2 family glycosyltransferase
LTDISVSIVNTNNRELLLGCLGTLQQRLNSDVEVEIVVLDNASDDGSAEAVRKRFPDVRLLQQGFRAGFGANHNTVIRATTGRYVYVLNEDTFSENWGLRSSSRRWMHMRRPGRSDRGSWIPRAGTKGRRGASRRRR